MKTKIASALLCGLGFIITSYSTTSTPRCTRGRPPGSFGFGPLHLEQVAKSFMKAIEYRRMVVRHELLAFAVTFILLLFSVLQSKAGMFPVPSVTGLCAEASVIAEGNAVGNDQVKVLKIYKGTEQTGTNNVIVVTDLEKCSKRIRNNGNNGESLQTDHVVLFMDSQLRPLYLFGEGSGGVFWLNEDACYRYYQPMNPGGYALAKLPTTPEELRGEIVVGLAVAKDWEEVKALKNPKAMAGKMAAYLRKATWQKGYQGEFDRELRERMPKLGADAVPPMLDVLRAGMKDGEDLNLPVLILYDIGEPAQPAVSVLLQLLKTPGKTSRYYICSALRTAGDPQAVPAIRSLLSSGDIQTEIEASRALAEMGDKQSFDPIAALVPQVESGRSDELHDLLSALYEMDAQKAVPIVERQLNDPAWAKSRDFIKPANYDALRPAKSGLNITGTLRDPSGSPVAGAVVSLIPNVYHNPEVKTDTSGRYKIKWRLFYFDASSDSASSYYLVARAGEQDLTAIRRIDEGTTNLDMTMQTGVTLLAKVKDASGKPVTNAVGHVSVMNGNGNGNIWLGTTFKSDVLGRIEINDIPRSDRYFLNIYAEGYRNGYEQMKSSAGQTNHLEFPVVVLSPANQPPAPR